MSENLKIKMELTEKDSVIYQLKVKAEQVQVNISKNKNKNEDERVDIGKNSPKKSSLFSAKKGGKHISQEMIRSLYGNIDSTTEDEKLIEELSYFL